MSVNNAIEIRNLTKRFDDFILDDISFDLPKGCILGLIGENGAGKSTTIRLIMDAVRRDAGSVEVMGIDNRSPQFSALKEDIGVVLDEANFPSVLNVKDVGRIMKNTYRSWNEQKFADYIRKFNLPEKKAFKDFSRGMKMKLSIATALSHDPKLLLLDEATAGLDPVVRDEILDIFYDFTRNSEYSILISSHIISDLEKLCDYIAFIHKGKLIFCREKDGLLEEYGILRCSWKQLDDVPKEAVLGKRSSKYGVECLVCRELLNDAFPVEKTSIEDIMLFMVKGEEHL